MTDLSQPPDADAGLFGLEWDLDAAETVIIGVPWEPTASYGRGTSRTPELLPKASHQLDFYEPFLRRTYGETVRMEPLSYSWVAMNARCLALADEVHRGDVQGEQLASHLKAVNQASEQLNDELTQKVAGYLDQGKKVGILGGDHSSPFGSIRAHAKRYPDMGLLHIDAHHDLRKAYEGFEWSHASIMYNVLHRINKDMPLVSVGIRDYCEEEAQLAVDLPGVTTFYDRDLKRDLFRNRSWADLCFDILKTLPKKVYVSLDVDGLDPANCPNTGTPVPGGLSFSEVCYLLERVRLSGRELIGFDLCEVGLGDSAQSEWDLNVGSRLLYKLCAVSSHKN